jgi:hypothetical protein
MTFFDRLNHNVATSGIGKYFRLEGSGARRERAGSKFTTEIRAGLTTFVAMVNSSSFLSLIFQHNNGPHRQQHQANKISDQMIMNHLPYLLGTDFVCQSDQLRLLFRSHP